MALITSIGKDQEKVFEAVSQFIKDERSKYSIFWTSGSGLYFSLLIGSTLALTSQNNSQVNLFIISRALIAIFPIMIIIAINYFFYLYEMDNIHHAITKILFDKQPLTYSQATELVQEFHFRARKMQLRNVRGRDALINLFISRRRTFIFSVLIGIILSLIILSYFLVSSLLYNFARALSLIICLLLLYVTFKYRIVGFRWQLILMNKTADDINIIGPNLKNLA